MSWSMGSIDCTAVKIDNDYVEALKKDIEEYHANPKMLEEMSEENRKQFEWLLDTLEEDDLDDVDTFYDHYCDYLSQYNSDNYAQEIKIDFESGECVGKAKDFDAAESILMEMEEE